MAYFSVLIDGKGIDLPVGHDVAVGFYVIRIVRAKSETEAVSLAKTKVEAEWSSRAATCRAPTLTLVKVEPTTFMWGFLARQLNCTFYSATHAVLARARLGA